MADHAARRQHVREQSLAPTNVAFSGEYTAAAVRERQVGGENPRKPCHGRRRQIDRDGRETSRHGLRAGGRRPKRCARHASHDGRRCGQPPAAARWLCHGQAKTRLSSAFVISRKDCWTDESGTHRRSRRAFRHPAGDLPLGDRRCPVQRFPGRHSAGLGQVLALVAGSQLRIVGIGWGGSVVQIHGQENVVGHGVAHLLGELPDKPRGSGEQGEASQ